MPTLRYHPIHDVQKQAPMHVREGQHPALRPFGRMILYGAALKLFVFGALVQKPLLVDNGVPFWLALFIGNVVSVALLNWLVPWSARRFDWWLTPQGPAVMRINLIGTGTAVGIYVLCLLAFALYSNWPLAR